MKFYPHVYKRKDHMKIDWCMLKPMGPYYIVETYCGRNVSDELATKQKDFPLGVVCMLCSRRLVAVGRS